MTAAQIPNLTLKWAFGFAGDVSAFAAPTVVDGHVFVGSAGGLVQALAADTGCTKWVFQANGPVRTAPLAVPRDGRHVLLFGDLTGWFYALDAATGELVWKTQLETHDSTRLTGAAAVHDGVAYVPVSSWEESRAGDPDYPCCTFRGSVVAVRVRDGAQLWKTYLTDEPRELAKNARGAPLYGPSGVAVWSTPTVDASTRPALCDDRRQLHRARHARRATPSSRWRSPTAASRGSSKSRPAMPITAPATAITARTARSSPAPTSISARPRSCCAAASGC